MAGSRPTAVHFTLIFFVMVSLFLGVIAYIFHSDLAEKEKSIADIEQQRNADAASITDLDNQVKTMKNTLGYPYESIGAASDPNSVIGAVNNDFSRVGAVLGQDPQQRNVREILLAMRTHIQNLTNTSTQANNTAQTAQATFAAQTSRQQTEVTQAKTDQTMSEGDLRDRQTTHQEALTKAQNETDKWRSQYNTVQGELEMQKDLLVQTETKLNERIADLRFTIKHQLEHIKLLEGKSFEAPDGVVDLVDNTPPGFVWINQGSLDYIRPQITFSVLTKDNSGIGRNPNDVKARLEVVEVTGPHRSKCRILEDDISRPIAPGDPIYSPLFQSGVRVRVAFVGIIDLDGDGKSDRELVQEIMNQNGAELVVYVDDHGQRQPADGVLDVTTKFLVVGKIPDPTDFPGQDELFREASDVGAQFGELKRESEDNGVEVINLGEFLTWIGARTEQKVYRPGDKN